MIGLYCKVCLWLVVQTLSFSSLTEQRFYSLLLPTLVDVCKSFQDVNVPEWQFGDSLPMTAKAQAHGGVLFLLPWHRILPLPRRTTHPSSWPSLTLLLRFRSYPFSDKYGLSISFVSPRDLYPSGSSVYQNCEG